MRLIKANTTNLLIFHSDAFGTYGYSVEDEWVHDWDIVSLNRRLLARFGYLRL